MRWGFYRVIAEGKKEVGELPLKAGAKRLVHEGGV